MQLVVIQHPKGSRRVQLVEDHEVETFQREVLDPMDDGEKLVTACGLALTGSHKEVWDALTKLDSVAGSGEFMSFISAVALGGFQAGEAHARSRQFATSSFPDPEAAATD